jgi:hypothetical protein
LQTKKRSTNKSSAPAPKVLCPQCGQTSRKTDLRRHMQIHLPAEVKDLLYVHFIIQRVGRPLKRLSVY